MSRRGILLYLVCGLAMTVLSSSALSQEKPPASDTVRPEAAIISIPADGEFYLGKEKITQMEIPLKLKEFFRDRPLDEQIVYIRASLSVKYKTVVSTIDTIRGAGFDQIALVKNSDRARKSKARSLSKKRRQRGATNRAEKLISLKAGAMSAPRIQCALLKHESPGR